MIHFEKKNDRADIVKVFQQLERTINSLEDGEYTLTIDKKKSTRSISQNRLMWLWFRCIEKETGSSQQDIHDYYSSLFLRRVVSINNSDVVVSGSTSKLTTEEFTTFLEKVQSDVASELGIVLPLPSDVFFDDFLDIYDKF